MTDIVTQEFNAALLAVGVFRVEWIREAGIPDNAQILPDGWVVVNSKDSLVSETVYRIADAIDVIVPPLDIAKATVKRAINEHPCLKEAFVSYPSTAALDVVVTMVGGKITAKGYDLEAMDEVIEMTEDEERLRTLLVATLDGACQAARLVKQFGVSGRRTWFNDHFLPTVPFIIHDKGQPVRLVGHELIPHLHKQDDEGRFVGLELSADCNRCLLEFVVSEQSVEGNSFNVPVGIKEIIAGHYKEMNSGIDISFSLERKNARKFSGMGAVVRKLHPDYMSGQIAYVVLDKITGESVVELHEARDDDAKNRMREMLKSGPVPVASEASGPSLAA